MVPRPPLHCPVVLVLLASTPMPKKSIDQCGTNSVANACVSIVTEKSTIDAREIHTLRTRSVWTATAATSRSKTNITVGAA